MYHLSSAAHGTRGVTMAYVARRLQRSIAYFRTHRAELEKRGFPPPLAMPGRPRWDAEAIERWLEAQMPRALQETPGRRDAWEQQLIGRAHEVAQGIADEVAA